MSVSPHQSQLLDMVLSIPHLARAISNGLSLADLARCLRVCGLWHALFASELARRDSPQSFSVRDAFYISPWIYCELDARYPSKTQLTWPHIRRLLPRPWDYHQDDNLSSNHGGDSEADEINEIDTEDDMISCLYFEDADYEDDGSGNGNGRDGSMDDANDPTARSMRIAQKLRNRLAHVPPFLYLKLAPGDDPRPHLQEPVLAQVLLNLPSTIQCLDLEAIDEMRDDDEIEQNSTFSFAHHISEQRDHRALKSLQVEFGYLASSLPYLNWFLLRCCPNLQRLRLKNVSHPRERYVYGRFEMPALPSLEHCSDLCELEMEGPFRHNGQTVQKTLGTITKLKVLTLKCVRMGPGMQWSALERSAATLETITLKHSSISSATIQAILVNCPALQHFAIDAEINTPVEAWLDIEDLIESPWMCLGLKTLSLPLAENSNATGNNIRDNQLPEKDRQLLVHKVYHQLSRLTALESLKICIMRGVDMGGNMPPYKKWHSSTIELDFSIRSGLGILSTLKQLKRLEFYSDQPGQPFRPNLGQEEVEWLATPGERWLNWPELTAIQLGTRPPAAAIEGQERGEAVIWKWLKERRPEIAVSWASSRFHRVG